MADGLFPSDRAWKRPIPILLREKDRISFMMEFSSIRYYKIEIDSICVLTRKIVASISFIPIGLMI
jgi:hypothetical protein